MPLQFEIETVRDVSSLGGLWQELEARAKAPFLLSWDWIGTWLAEAVRASGKPYLDHLSANTRQQIRRSVRLYEERGRLEARRAHDVGEGMQFLDGLADLHQRYWLGRGEPGGFGHPFFESFLRRLTE